MGKSRPELAGRVWGRQRKRLEARRVPDLSHEFRADLGWWRLFVEEVEVNKVGRMAAPFSRFVKPAPGRTWFSDASYGMIGGLCVETGV